MIEEYVYEPVWSGERKGVYLTALKGVEPFVARNPTPEELVIPKPKAQPGVKTGEMIMELLLKRGPLTQSQLASGCNRAHSEVKKAIRRRAMRGDIVLMQPPLLAIDPHAGALWRLA